MIKPIQYCQSALTLKNDIESNFMLLAEHLYNIKEHSLWNQNWGSWEEFTFELKMSNRNVNRLIQIYKLFILDYSFSKKEVADAGVSLLGDVLPAISSREDAEEWLHKTTVLTRSDLRKELTEHKTGIQMKHCKHKDFYIIKVCRDCGDKIQEHGD